MMSPSALVGSLTAPSLVRRLVAALTLVVCAGFAAAQDPPLKVAVDDVRYAPSTPSPLLSASSIAVKPTRVSIGRS